MATLKKPKPKYFYVVGLSYKKADIEIRGKFSLHKTAQKSLLLQGKQKGITPLVVLSTCNRTEVYGAAENPYQLISLLFKHSKGTEEDFEKVGFVYKEQEAINYIFQVGAGLESQIIGDFEVIGQLKQAFMRSKALGLINAYFERLFNSVIHTSKRLKNETKISSGITSVAYAPVDYILNSIENVNKKNILLFGLGKLGRNTCENLIKHTNRQQVTVVNRTDKKTHAISQKLEVVFKRYDQLTTEISQADLLIVATGAQKPTVSLKNLNLHKPLLVLDLSIPQNVAPNVSDNKYVTLIHLDELSKTTNETIKERQEDIPKAEKIIEEEKDEFLKWLHSRRYAPTIQALKKKLETIKEKEIDYHNKKAKDFDKKHTNQVSSRIIQKVTTHFATHFKRQDENLEESKAWVEKVFQLNTEHYE